MSMNDSRRSRQWVVPAACGVFAAAYLAIGIAHHQLYWGIVTAAIMVAFGAAVAVGGRRGSGAASMISGEPLDERYAHLEARSLAFAGRVLILVVTAGMFWSLAADNQYRTVFTALAAVAGVSVFGAQMWNARRG